MARILLEAQRSMAKANSVLVVDDDLGVRQMLVALLRNEGFDVQSAANAHDALEAVLAADFDAVLTDIQMPTKDGFALLEELRELRPATPVILMTALHSPASAAQARRLGAFGYLAKPLSRDQVLAILERALQR